MRINLPVPLKRKRFAVVLCVLAFFAIYPSNSLFNRSWPFRVFGAQVTRRPHRRLRGGRATLVGTRREHHNQASSIHGGNLFDGRDPRELTSNLFERLTSDGRVGDLATAKQNANLDLIPFVQPLARPVQFESDVIIVCLGADANFFDFDLLLPFFRFALFLMAFILEFAKIHDSTDRRLRIRSDFNQIQILVACNLECLGNRQNTQLFARIVVDDPDFADSNAFVYAQFFVDCGSPPESKKTHPKSGENITYPEKIVK